jgi:uncharacterized protein (DUF1684 family)
VTLSLLDWRRRVGGLYAAARTAGDPETAWRGWRDGRDELFAEHPDSPLDEAARAAFRGLPFSDYDPAQRFEVPVDPAEPLRLDLPTADDGAVPLHRMGTVTLGDLGRLDVWWLGGYGGGIFLPLRDGTAGRTSYGGGRYLLDTIKSADLGSDATSGTVVLDFNYAYHPSCTYDPRWVCPLAPPDSRLRVPIRAGERLLP